jgi:DNA-directed RNA polymerase subunit M
MEFCPKCGAMLVQKTKNLGCPRCGYSSSHKASDSLKISEKIDERKEVAVVSNKDIQVNPIVEQKCEKCGHNRCYFWTLQTRSSDESETKFFKCVKCGHTWREYR